eukprot:TRINITY_DN48917_c0_g1_i1.p1 TRINITY_DN48917_c0_g1~~TRINITY_DN48917_c0_g1_i1.p1  ORF type:complete len:419 (+),score=60.33 TRINITY_DN48917_c0_g1_i1:25-1257(+)
MPAAAPSYPTLLQASEATKERHASVDKALHLLDEADQSASCIKAPHEAELTGRSRWEQDKDESDSNVARSETMTLSGTEAANGYDEDADTQDGGLDFHQICSLLRQANSTIKDSEVQSLFDALRKTTDQKVQLGDLRDFLHPTGGSFEYLSWRTGHKLRKALDAACVAVNEHVPKQERGVYEVLLDAVDSSIDHKFRTFDLSKLVKYLESPTWPRSKPGPGDYDADDHFDSRRKTFPSSSFGSGPGHLHRSQARQAPGPASYNLRRMSTSPRQQSSIARSKRHSFTDMGERHATDFPTADADAVDAVSHHRRAPCATFGFGPGHGARFSFEYSKPGPASYDCKFSTQAHLKRAPAASIGLPRKDGIPTSQTSPGPATYTIAEKRNCSRGLTFNIADRFCLPPLTPFDLHR